MSDARRQILGFLIAFAALVALLGIAGVALWLTQPSQPGNIRFVRSVWLANRGPLDPERGRMSLDLIHRHLRSGMTRRQVRHLLGAPDSFGDANTYTIGAAPGFPGGEIDLVFRHDRLVRAFRFACCALGATNRRSLRGHS